MSPLQYFLFITVTHIFKLNDALPQVRVRPKSAVITSSSETRLYCESDSQILSVAYWTHVGTRIEIKPNVIEASGNELRISQFGDTAYTQPGEYACVVKTKYGLLASEPALLSLPTLDPFKSSTNLSTTTLNITEGNIAVIPCDLPNGNPKPVPIFSFDNGRIIIDRDTSRYKILLSGNLHIINVKISDTGKYRCSAKNPVTYQIVNSSKSIFLNVTVPKEKIPLIPVYIPPSASRVLVGDNFSLECVVAGAPVPVIEWEKYSNIMPEKRSEVLHGTLYLYDIRSDDRGSFICRASSSIGYSDVAYTALLDVLEPPKVVQRPDSLIQIQRGENAYIRCGFRGRPEPVITWLFNGEEVSLNGSPAIGGTLTINEVKESNQGIYQCIGRNLYGMAHASAALVLPTFQNNKTQNKEVINDNSHRHSLIIIGPSNMTVYEGETVQLNCLTKRGVTVQWLHENVIINPNLMRRYEKLTSGGLRIVSAQKSDSGYYECIASDGFGTTSAKCYMNVRGLITQDREAKLLDENGENMLLPLQSYEKVIKIEIIDMVQIDNNAVDLFWEINGTSDLNYVQVQYGLLKNNWLTNDENLTTSVKHAIIDTLQAGYVYKFRLVGFDQQGQQIVSSSVRKLKLEYMDNNDHLTKPVQSNMNNNSPIPRITDAWALQDGSIGVKWQLPTNSTTSPILIDGFAIFYRLSRIKSNYTKITIPNVRFPPIDTYTITTIEPNQQYELRMATYSSRGLSQMSNPMEILVPPISNQQAAVNRRSRINNYNDDSSSIDLEEILENITKLQSVNGNNNNNPSATVLSTSSSLALAQKNSDLLYLITGAIAGVLLLLLIILVIMCGIRYRQHKKFVAHVKSANGSAFYEDAIQKGLNPANYALTPTLTHGVVAVDGKLIPFAYPSSHNNQHIVWNNPTQSNIITSNGTIDTAAIHINSNPLDEQVNQENFYHTLTPFSTLPFDEHSCSNQNHGLFGYNNDRGACPIHRTHNQNYTSDTFPLKSSSTKDGNSKNNANNLNPTQNHFHHQFLHHHIPHATCQRFKDKKHSQNKNNINNCEIIHDLCDRSFCHSSNDSSHPLLVGDSNNSSELHHCTAVGIRNNMNNTTSMNGVLVQPCTGSDSSSGIGSSVESPYTGWKYLTPLCVSTSSHQQSHEQQTFSPNDKQNSSDSTNTKNIRSKNTDNLSPNNSVLLIEPLNRNENSNHLSS
ncbi:unnamed protein product [Didymodactylos carnosus]|uniref:Uncharacterized protein n=1 Tax=Didymodactylos carnosus TaxID=1234261 RepID=A0A8S2CSU5_9BILA|nr:unnamed protein product [Didymodactylos carnosus]CAF3577670.1 unnamed protein product [Didymodactylos carnosus]